MWTTAKETFAERHWLVLHTYLHHHPAFRVTVYATELPLDFFTPLSRWGYAVRVARIDDALLAELRKACPGKRWVDQLDEWRRGPYFYSHLTDYLRFCLLARTGGVYSDFDAYLLQPLDPALPDFIGKDVGHPVRGSCDWCLEDGHHYLAPGVMGAGAPQAPLLLTALQLAFDGEYRPHVFNAVGPQAVTAAYKALPAAALATLHVFEPAAFYPLPYWRAHEWLAPENGSSAALTPDEAADVRLELLARQSVSLHLFGHMTGRLAIAPGSVAARLAPRYHVVADPAPGADTNNAGPLYTVRGPAYAAVVRDHTTLRAWRIVPAAHASPSQHLHLHIDVVVQGAFRLGALQRSTDASTVVVLNATRLCTTVATVAEANLWLGAVALSAAPQDPPDVAGFNDDRNGNEDGNDANEDGRLTIRVHLRSPTLAPSSCPSSSSSSSPADEEAHLTVPMYDVPRLVTVMVKTTGRIAKVFELLQSLRVRYPTVSVVAADDGEHAGHSRNLARDPHFAYLALPFDVGLSAGRNAMLDRVATPYVLTLDDDFTLDGASVIEALLHTVAAGHADLAAGRNPVDEDRYGFEFSGLLEVNSTTLALVPGHRGRIGTGSSCCRRVDIVPNLFLARTARLRTLRWDPALKLGEHEDFFLRAQRAGWIVAACPAVAFVHGGSQSWFTLTETSSAYDRMRSRIHQFWELALRKHGLTRLVSFGTVVLDLAGPAPVAEVMAGEVLPSAFTVYWSPSPWATKYELVVQMHGRPWAGGALDAGRDAGVRRTYDACPVQIIDVSPATAYTVTVYALIAHIRERFGRTITVHTPPAMRGIVYKGPAGIIRRRRGVSTTVVAGPGLVLTLPSACKRLFKQDGGCYATEDSSRGMRTGSAPSARSSTPATT